MKKQNLIRGFLMTALLSGGIIMSAGDVYASSGYFGAGNRTDNTESSRSGYLGAGDRSGYAGAGSRTDNTTIAETNTDETTIGTIFSDLIIMIIG